MYLSKLLIGQRDAMNPYKYHQIIWELFPECEDEKRSFLFRTERRIPGMGMEILLQSINKPAQVSERIRILANKEFNPVFYNGQNLRFKLVANSVKMITDSKNKKTDGESHKIRVPLIKEVEQIGWLERKLNGCCELKSVLVRNDLPLFFYKQKTGKGKIQPVCYEGTLIVTNKDELEDSLVSGIGPAKAFGCGLLSLARP